MLRVVGALGAFGALAMVGAGAGGAAASTDKAGATVITMDRDGKDLFFSGPEAVISGSDLKIKNKTNPRQVGPHTFSLVKRSQLPRTMKQMENCFGRGPCDDLALAHGAVNPDTGEEQEPTTPLVNVGAAGFNRPGDSVLIPPGGRTKVKITGSSDKYYLCAIHPWMLGKVDVVG